MKNVLKNTNKKNSSNIGWATLELVLILPMLILVLGLIYYAGKVGFSRLHLTNAVDAGARIAAVKGCNEGENFVKASFSYSHLVKPQCKSDPIIEFKGTYKVEFPLAVLSGLNQEIIVYAYALNELEQEL